MERTKKFFKQLISAIKEAKLMCLKNANKHYIIK
jgi:hypothetical protein